MWFVGSETLDVLLCCTERSHQYCCTPFTSYKIAPERLWKMGHKYVLEVALYFLSVEVYPFSTPTCPEFTIIRAALEECASRNIQQRCGLTCQWLCILQALKHQAQTCAFQEPVGNYLWLNTCCVLFRKQFFLFWVKFISIYRTNNARFWQGVETCFSPASLLQWNSNYCSWKTRAAFSFVTFSSYYISSCGSASYGLYLCLYVLERETETESMQEYVSRR